MTRFIYGFSGVLTVASLLLGPQPASAQTPAPGTSLQGGAPEAAPPKPPARQGGPPPQGGAAPQGRRGGEGAEAATPPPPVIGVTAMTTVTRVVANIERTMEFYRQVFGFQSYGSAGLPLPNSAMGQLSNLKEMRFRQLPVRLPNSGLLLRLMEFSKVERTPGKPKQVTDPGETHLRLEVSDVEAVVANLQRAGAQFVAPATAQAARTSTAPILVRDIDGFLLEILKGIGSQGSNIGVGASPVLQARVVITTDSTEKSLAFYKDIIGVNINGDAMWTKVPVGAPGEVRASLSGDIGGPGRVIELREYRNAGEKSPFKPRLQDPGASLLSYIIKDLAEVTKRVQAANLPVVTPEAKPVTLANLQRLIVQDPDGVFIELVQE